MQVHVGDRLIVKGHCIGDPYRDAEILEIRGPGGTPPFLVRWEQGGGVRLLFPDPEDEVRHCERAGCS